MHDFKCLAVTYAIFAVGAAVAQAGAKQAVKKLKKPNESSQTGAVPQR